MATSLSNCGLSSNTIPWANPSPQPKQHLDRFSRLCRDDRSVPILYNGTPLPPSKLPLPTGDLGPPSNTWYPGPTQVLNPNGILIGSAVFAGLTSVTDRITERPRYSVGNNRPHLHT